MTTLQLDEKSTKKKKKLGQKQEKVNWYIRFIPTKSKSYK